MKAQAPWTNRRVSDVLLPNIRCFIQGSLEQGRPKGVLDPGPRNLALPEAT